jgi:hypothetical protein
MRGCRKPNVNGWERKFQNLKKKLLLGASWGRALAKRGVARPHVTGQDLRAGYAAIAADEAREAEAEAWSEGLIGDVAVSLERRA